MIKGGTIAEYRKLWKSKGLCLDCGVVPITTGFRCETCKIRHRESNRKYVEINKESRKQRYEARRLRVLAHYGLICACCGEAETRFLTLDHINNDGYLHRKDMRKNVYRWAESNGFPTTLQTLCFNCNCGKAHNGGTCPHKTKRIHLIA